MSVTSMSVAARLVTPFALLSRARSQRKRQARPTAPRALGAALAVLASVAAAPAAWAVATYSFTGGTYTNQDNCTAPGTTGAGPCVQYTSAMRVTGWFSLFTPLPANFGPADISTRPDLAFSFSDGINTYNSTDTTHVYVEPGWFKVKTDAAGVPVYVGTQIALNQWQTTPAVNNYLNALDTNYTPFSTPPLGEYATTGWQCFQVDVNGRCTTDNYGANIARAWGSATEGVWTVSVTENPAAVPALGRGPLLVLAGLLALAGAAILFRGAR